MNKKMVIRILGIVMGVEAILLLFPFIVGLIYKEESGIHYLITSILCAVLYLFSSKVQVEKKAIYAKEGFVITSLAWIAMSLFGAIPLYSCGDFPTYVDAFFEIVSGFTTTGSSVATAVEDLTHATLFWRSFSHWIGGMGVLVFILSVVKLQGDDHNMHIMRAESPGPIVGKLVPKIKNTASLLYGIYTVMTLALILALLITGMPLFDSICNALGAAGTGGFSVTNTGIGQYNNVVWEVIISIGMFLFGVNFNFYFFLLMKDIKGAFSSEEVKWYFVITFSFITLITLNLTPFYGNVFEALRQSSFQVSSIITTTGYASCDFNLWPQFSKTLLLVLMFVGACAGSTGGGVKISRWVIMFKKLKNTISKLLHPRSVKIVTLEKKVVDDDVVSETFVFFVCFMLVFFTTFIIVSLDGFDLESTFTAVSACLGNVGPGFGMVGPMGNFSEFSALSKIALSLAMLFGRLEIFPMLITLLPMTYIRNTKL